MWAMLMVLLAQVPPVVVPCTPGETSLVCSCKAGQASACALLSESDPEKYAQVLKALMEARKLAEEVRAKAAQAAGVADANEPPDCKGQEHHPISRLIASALEKHPKLKGIYKPRDSRFVARAVDAKAHCGYQDWHREIDAEVTEWLKRHPDATYKEFEAYLREIYARPEMQARFPNGF